MDLVKYIKGPSLIGAIFFIAGFIMKQFPPRQINSFYGYRTSSSMKNQQTWDEANSYSARWMIIMGISVFIFGMALLLIMDALIVPDNTQSIILAATSVGLAVAAGILLLVITEKHLTRTFGNN